MLKITMTVTSASIYEKNGKVFYCFGGSVDEAVGRWHLYIPVEGDVDVSMLLIKRLHLFLKGFSGKKGDWYGTAAFAEKIVLDKKA